MKKQNSITATHTPADELKKLTTDAIKKLYEEKSAEIEKKKTDLDKELEDISAELKNRWEDIAGLLKIKAKTARFSSGKKNGKVSKNERKILVALSGGESSFDGVVKATGIKNPSSVLGKAREKGWIEGKGKNAMFKITEAGRAVLNGSTENKV